MALGTIGTVNKNKVQWQLQCLEIWLRCRIYTHRTDCGQAHLPSATLPLLLLKLAGVAATYRLMRATTPFDFWL